MIDWREHIPLARSIAQNLFKHLKKGAVGFEELEQDALIGLHAAAKTFDTTRNVKFSTYASRRIAGKILEGLRDRDGLSRGQRRSGSVVIRSIHAPDRLEREYGDRLTASTRPPLQSIAERSVLDRAISMVQGRTLRTVLRLRYSEDLTLLEIGRALGVSESRVSQLHTQAIQILQGRTAVGEAGELVFKPRRSVSVMPANLNGHNQIQKTPPAKPVESVVPPGADVAKAVEQFQQLPAWLQSLRSAMESSIKADDIQGVMKKQVEKAKEGNLAAANFVMNQAHKLLNGPTTRPVTFVQKNYYSDSKSAPAEEDAEGRSRAPGRPEKMSKTPDFTQLQKIRQEHGVPRPISDEEEKELRRREEAELSAA